MNQIEKLVVEPKPKVIKEKKEKEIIEEIVEEQPKDIRRSSRGLIPNRQATDLGFVEKNVKHKSKRFVGKGPPTI